MIGPAPTQEGAGSLWPRSWVLWFKKLELALSGWKRVYTQEFDYTFGSVPAIGQLFTIAIVEGVRKGAVVIISPDADTTGIIFTAVATSANNVTIYAKNFTFNPVAVAKTNFRIIVLQD
jgi:hypothetical protein